MLHINAASHPDCPRPQGAGLRPSPFLEDRVSTWLAVPCLSANAPKVSLPDAAVLSCLWCHFIFAARVRSPVTRPFCHLTAGLPAAFCPLLSTLCPLHAARTCLTRPLLPLTPLLPGRRRSHFDACVEIWYFDERWKLLGWQCAWAQCLRTRLVTRISALGLEGECIKTHTRVPYKVYNSVPVVLYLKPFRMTWCTS